MSCAHAPTVQEAIHNYRVLQALISRWEAAPEKELLKRNRRKS